MIEPRFQVVVSQNLKELITRGSELVDNDVASVFEKSLMSIIAVAMKSCPVDTGRLRADIGHRFNRRELEAVIYNTVEYSVFVHEGTRHMSARPYILNAIKDRGEVQMQRDLDREVLRKHREL